jgi:hypothetical protein
MGAHHGLLWNESLEATALIIISRSLVFLLNYAHTPFGMYTLPREHFCHASLTLNLHTLYMDVCSKAILEESTADGLCRYFML